MNTDDTTKLPRRVFDELTKVENRESAKKRKGTYDGSLKGLVAVPIDDMGKTIIYVRPEKKKGAKERFLEAQERSRLSNIKSHEPLI